MKEYLAPAMTVLDFVTDEALANPTLNSTNTNDAEFGPNGWT